MNLKDILKNISGEQEMEFMPIIPIGDVVDKEDKLDNVPGEIPVIALRNTVLFPNVILPITVGREKSIRALDAAQSKEPYLGVVMQKDSNLEDPLSNDLYKVGVIAKVVKTIKMPDGATTIFIMGKARMKIKKITQEEPYLRAEIDLLVDNFPKSNKAFEALMASLKETAERIVQLSPNIPDDSVMMLKNVDNKSFLLHFIASNLGARLDQKQSLLEINDVKKRGEKLLQLLHVDLQMAELKNEITNKARGEMDKQQREYFLQQQLKSINDELGNDGTEKDVRDLEAKAQTKTWSTEAQESFAKDIDRLRRTHPSSPDYAVNFNHAELLLDLPWDTYSKDKIDLNHTQKVLNKDHYGMEKIKERIVEYLAVLKLKGDMKAPILCFVGPPGIGKTSLAHSIAHAIGRSYARISLGGLHDESELRGHRKTYIGAMPGRLIQTIKKCKASNPVIILDEIDKMSNDYHGDPSSAMLEILDPEQNKTFYDNYLEVNYDLSKVLFICTANSLSTLQPALRDRLEIIQLSGYSAEEKIEIAKKYLIPAVKEDNGMSKINLKWSQKILTEIIENYTRESGVRELKRQLAAIIRHLAAKMAKEEEISLNIDADLIIKALGKPIYSNDLYKEGHPAGVVVGLAWTSVGGDVLFIESSLSKGKGQLTLTGNLGDVMKESASTALSFIKAHNQAFGIEDQLFEERNIHVHVPEGAVPKDGPSAGITMLTSLVSAFTGKKVKPYLAMTGEITLRGEVLPVGGIKEKVLAAKRFGIKEIILCEQNRKDIEDINATYIKGIQFHYVTNMLQVIDLAII